MNSKPHLPLNTENILIEEYKYASSYTLQMLQERGNMLTLYSSFIAVIFTGGIGLRLFDELIINYEEALPPLFLAIGVMHALLFKRFAYLETKYHEYQERMNNIREVYVEHIKGVSPKINSILAPITMPKSLKLFYPIWGTTLLFWGVSSLSFSLSAFYQWDNLTMSVLIFFFSLGIILKVGKATGTS